MPEQNKVYDAGDYLLTAGKRIPYNFKVCFFATYIIGLIAHAYSYFMPIFAHDAAAVSQGISLIDAAAGARWFQAIIIGLEEHSTLPWLIGLMTLFFYSVSSWCICELLQINRRIPIIMISGILVTSPNATCCNYYQSGAHALAFALMACLLSVYAFYKLRHGIVWSVIFLLLGAGTYVSYVDMAMSVFLIMQIGRLLERRKEDLQDIIKKHFQMLAVFGGGYIGTYLINWAIYTVAGETPQGRVSDALGILAGNDSKGGITGLLLRVVKAMYHSVAAVTPIRNYSYFQQRHMYYAIFCVALLLTLAIAVYLIVRQRMWQNKLLFVLLLFDSICLLLAISFIDIFQVPHPLMTAAYVIPWLFMVQLYELNYRMHGEEMLGRVKVLLFSAVILLNSAVTIVEGCILSNTVYAMAYNNYMSGMMVLNRVAERVESTDGYEVGSTPVAIIGTFFPYSEAQYFDVLQGFSMTTDLIWYNSAIPFDDSINKFIHQHLRLNMNTTYYDYEDMADTEKAIEAYAAENGYAFDSATFENMVESDAAFPSAESVQRCGDIVVVILR